MEMAKLGPRHLILACRNKQRGVDAEKSVRAVVKEGSETEVEFMQLDLNDLNSVKAFAEKVNNRFDKIDILVNNAGIMASWKR